jgi:integrase
MALTDTACKNAKPKQKVYKLGDSEGLFLLIKPNGKKHWRLKYYFLKKERLMALGAYPHVKLQQARQKKDDARVLLEQGIDPMMDKRKREQLAHIDSKDTFEAVANEWYENRKSRWSANYAKGVQQRLEKDLYPQLGLYPINQIEPPMILSAIRLIEKRNARELAKRQLQKCGEIFQYAMATGRVKHDPTYGLSKALEPVIKSHYNSIPIEELPEFLKILERNDARLYPTTRNGIKLLMHTFVRTSELINAEWDEIDFNNALWSIPAHRMKMKRPHKVPLSRQVVEILKAQKELTGHWPHVFPSPVKPKQPMSNNAILNALKGLGYRGRMTGHGFRSLAMSTIKEKLNYRHEVVDRQLAHVQKSKIDQAYDRADYMDDRAKMMQEWSDYIDTLTMNGEVIEVSFKEVVNNE